MINAIRVKCLRSSLRHFLGHLPKLTLEPTPTPQVLVPDFSRGLQANGTPHMKLVDGVTQRVLARGCQRFAYQAAKKQIAQMRRQAA